MEQTFGSMWPWCHPELVNRVNRAGSLGVPAARGGGQCRRYGRPMMRLRVRRCWLVRGDGPEHRTVGSAGD